MASGWFNNGIYAVVRGDVSLLGNSLVCALFKPTASFDRDKIYLSEMTAHEISVSGYARQELASKTISKDNTRDAAYLDAQDPVFGPLTPGQTIAYMGIFVDTGDDATSPLLMCWQIVEKATDNSEFTFSFSANGISKFWSAT